MSTTLGLHHVTAIASSPGINLAFYTRTLGLRLVKRSVNQDAPDTYHLFYADGAGTPGTDLTFFPWPQAAAGRPGSGMCNQIGLAIPPATRAWWRDRLLERGIDCVEEESFGEPRLSFHDPDGLSLLLVESAAPRSWQPWADGPVDAAFQIRGLHSARLEVVSLEPSCRFAETALGLLETARDGGWRRLQAADHPGVLDLREARGLGRGRLGPGTVHHVAWRAGDSAAELALRERVAAAGADPTPVIDRFWFRSVYFREPGGVLFELATDEPGFTADEDAASLGSRLILPPWLEDRRVEIERVLPPLRTEGG